MNVRRLTLLSLLAPLLSIAAAIGAVGYQYSQLNAAHAGISRDRRIILDLKARVTALRREQGLEPGQFAGIDHEHDHDHAGHDDHAH